ncbi:DNA primase [Micromonospora sp. CPCC 206061]|uniref:DNA primase n=1 Tax=Micromonospora sp. CPCC 206061 TaxID=3122410 RepID=UPI002FF19C98
MHDSSHTEVSVARQSPHRPNADEPEVDELEADELDEELDDDTPTAEGAAATGDRSLWADTRIEPVEIALPSGVGLTLRAYRLSTTLTPTDIGEREEDPFESRARHAVPEDDEDTVVILDDDFPAEEDEDATEEIERRGKHERNDEDDETDADEEEDEEPAEDVPVFLSHKGELLLFKNPESLVAFVRSGAPNDLAQLDTWNELRERIQPSDVAASEEDSYELDLVVENLRGGHDSWDLHLLIDAGEVARDLAYALRLQPVLTALSPGSPLDDLDEALRSAAGGGLGAFRGRRRLKKIGAQQASIGWRTIIGKISAAVDWRD